MTVAVNTAATLDLAPFTSGGATGVGVVSAPANGVVTVSGTAVTYTPAANYFGADTFTYAAFNGAGSSAPATVTVTVSGRPDPSQDAVVRGVLRAQADTAKRFARTQISNIQRRMESLHLGSGSGEKSVAAGFGVGRGESPNQDSAFAPGRDPFTTARAALRPGAGLSDMYVMDNTSSGRGLVSRTTSSYGMGREDYASLSPALMPASFMTTLADLAGSGSLNLSTSGRADGIAAQGTGLWLGGSLNFGTRDNTGDSNGLRFTTDGLTVGLDHRFNDKLALGASVGYARDKTRIGEDGSHSHSHGTSIAIYGSYSPVRNIFIDGLLGYGGLSYDSQRYVAAVTDFARANRKGNQWFGSIAAGYEHRQDGFLLSPYGRLDFGIDRLKRVTETGAGPNALTYHDQTLRSLDLSLGLRAETAHQANFGWVVPRLRVELRHAFEGDRTATIGYADQPAGPLYSAAGLTSNHNWVLVGFGSDFILRDGLKLGIDYQTLRSSGPDHSHSVRFWLSKDLDGKGLPTGLVASKLFDDPVRVEAGLSWDNNLNRARDASEKISDRIYSINISQGMFFPLADHVRVVASGFVSGDKLYTYSGLDRLSGGISGELQYRTSGEFDAVTFGLFGRANLDEYSSNLRSGHRYSLGLNARHALTDRIDIFAALARNFRNARSEVFDARDSSVRFNLDYSLAQNGSLYFGGEYRRGDMVTSAPSASIAYADLAKVSVADDAYGSAALIAHRYEAKTTIWTLGYNYPLGARDSLDFSWRYARSTPTAQIDPLLYPGGNSAYSARLYSIAYLMRF
jgi:outer membrane autotransporter protein